MAAIASTITGTFKGEGPWPGEDDDFKKRFDSDPGGRKGIATGHTVRRNVENPNDVFIRTEYASVEDAKKVRHNYSTPAPSATLPSRLRLPSSKSQTRPPTR
jgi:hypothetical protein